MKKITIFLCLILLFTLNVSAFDISYITPDKDFIVYSDNSQKVAEILNIDKKSLADTIEENEIIYLAVNDTNTKQIQVTCKETEFSASVKNLSTLSADNINVLLPSITGAESIKGEILYKDNQKYVRTDIRTGRDKNECILTQFFTIKNSKMYTISFYTNIDESTEYINTTFITTDIEPVKNEEDTSPLKIVIISATLIFAGVCAVLLYTIIKDLVTKNDNTETELHDSEKMEN